MTTRKQREILERHELILDKARKLFIEQGYHSVTMDSIAKEMEYSKGTIYKHFSCKECIILTLCSRVCSLMLELFTLIANEKHLNPRMQIILMFESFMLFQELRQDDVQLKLLADSQPFCVKVPDTIANESKQIEQQTFEVVVGIVNRAIENKQIILKEGSNAENIALGGWGLAQGIYMLTQNSGCASTFSIDQPNDLLRVNSKLFLDGVGWETYGLTVKRKQLISEYSVKFKEVINGYYSSF
ncbi:MAG: AcrR family transcriptional regulator [Enterobacterales bacterium]|jgi:AcrR family transcriptional regulator